MFTFTDPAADNKDLMGHMVERYVHDLGDFLGETNSTGTAAANMARRHRAGKAVQQYVWRPVHCCCCVPCVLFVIAGCLSLISLSLPI